MSGRPRYSEFNSEFKAFLQEVKTEFKLPGQITLKSRAPEKHFELKGKVTRMLTVAPG